MKRYNCSICDSELNHIFKIENMPIKLCCVDIPEYNQSPLSFSICKICNNIQLDNLIPLEILYSSSHNTVSVGKVWENYFQLFCKKVKELTENKNVLEIGDPSGRIANELNNYQKWYIIEPNKNENIKYKENIYFIEGFFDEKCNIDFKMDIIIHSHVFEHIYSPNNFLKKCWDILKEDGEMFFGIPNMDYIAKNNIAPCLGIFFEHTIFLNKENVSYMLEKNGFKIISIIDYENHSILFHVKKNIIPLQTLSPFGFVPREASPCVAEFMRMDTPSKDDSSQGSLDLPEPGLCTLLKNVGDNKPCEDLHTFLLSIKEWQKFITKINDDIKEDTREVYLFGASYNTQYLLALGMENNKIAGILDNCKEKQGKYLYGYDLCIYSPNIIINKDCIVVVKNGYYSKEIIQQLFSLNDKIKIIY